MTIKNNAERLCIVQRLAAESSSSSSIPILNLLKEYPPLVRFLIRNTQITMAMAIAITTIKNTINITTEITTTPTVEWKNP